MIDLIDDLLSKITMYRLVLYFLIILLVIAGIFGMLGILPYNPVAVAFTAIFLTIAAWVVNWIFAWFFKAHPNSESAYITALILSLIITPVMPSDVSGVFFLLWAAVFAMGSKYIFAINKKHIFNPAAFAVAVTAFTIQGSATWWIGGTLPMMAFVIAGGLLVVRKVQRFDLVTAYVIGAALSCTAVRGFADPFGTLEKIALHTPVFFFASIMITEPLTTPPTRMKRIMYGALVGLLYAPQVNFAGIYSTPELALLVGNIFSFAVSPKGKQVLALKEKKEVGTNIYDFAFKYEKPIKFRPGQYMEWTLAHPKNDLRGNRRYFTIASSPTEPDIRLGVRFNTPSSTFKKALIEMNPGDTVVAGQLAGDFTLPRDPKEKLVFIAGGIGITPFRSMVKYLSDRDERRDIILLYSNRTVDEISYRDVFDEAAHTIGLRTIYAITDEKKLPPGAEGYNGFIDAALIQREIPDFRDRTFYISGTHGMTVAFRKALTTLGVPITAIRTDFFPGFA